jgi:DNA-binding CsgD family transcriptional regulator
MLPAKEMAVKLDISREAVYSAENTLERKIGDTIKKFRVLAL